MHLSVPDRLTARNDSNGVSSVAKQRYSSPRPDVRFFQKFLAYAITGSTNPWSRSNTAMVKLFGLKNRADACQSAVACAVEMIESLDEAKDLLRQKHLPVMENIGGPKPSEFRDTE